MISEYHITLKLTDEERELLDRARGNTDLDTFAHSKLLAIAEVIIDSDELTAEDDAPLTTADHLRLIAEAENDYMELDEFLAAARVDFEQLKAQAHVESKR